jgi:hypothetical protein
VAATTCCALADTLASLLSVEAAQEDDGRQLLSLPASVLADILVRSGSCKSILGSSRAGRDAVLHSIRRLTLETGWDDTSATSRPLARLLHRACTQAAPGLALKLDLGHSKWPAQSQRGKEGWGWTNVHQLLMMVRVCPWTNSTRKCNCACAWRSQWTAPTPGCTAVLQSWLLFLQASSDKSTEVSTVDKDGVLGAILQPGVDSGGWRNVHTLEVSLPAPCPDWHSFFSC